MHIGWSNFKGVNPFHATGLFWVHDYHLHFTQFTNIFNPLSANPTKWGCGRRIVWLCFDNFWGLALKGLTFLRLLSIHFTPTFPFYTPLKHQKTCGNILVTVTLFFVRTSKFFLRLAVLIFFYFCGWNVLNLFLFPRLNFETNAKRMPDWVQQKHTISFLSFFFFQAAYIGSH